jgi:hypothetical protein
MYPGNSDPWGYGTNMVPQAPWDEQVVSNTPSDRRGVASAGPFAFPANKQMCIDLAYVYGQGSYMPNASVFEMQDAADSAHAFYAQNNPCTCDDNTTGIAHEQSSVAGIYPNPATESINIICGDNATGSLVEIVDVNGKVVKTATVLSGNSVVVPTQDLAPGVYFVRVNKGSVVLTGKFIRN